jgi:aspartate carbamoyltransferase catalytic subunit
MVDRMLGKHLLGLEGVKKQDLTLILNTARSFLEVLERPIRRVPTLRGKTIVNLFFEPSTRTRISFELAQKRLSADTVNFSAAASSVKKGETLKDTARNIEAMKIDMVVIRHSAPGAAHFLTRCVEASVINAGDGSHEHPTQALLDLMTIRENKGRIAGLNVLIVGDIAHSRVARSNIWGLKTMGATVSVCAPTTLMPAEAESLGVKVYHHLNQALPEADVVNVLRLQLERMDTGFFPSLREYHKHYGITRERLRTQAKKDVMIMHPGPMNRGVEISSEVADGEQSVILQQVTYGVAVRMAVIFLFSGGEAISE